MEYLNTMRQYKNWRKPDGNYLTVREYNKLAKQAWREGQNTTDYLVSLGYVKVWGKGKGSGYKERIGREE